MIIVCYTIITFRATPIRQLADEGDWSGETPQRMVIEMVEEGRCFMYCPEESGLFMFTGIIRATAKVNKSERKKGSLFLSVQKPKNWKLKPGDSIAVDGVCLTVKQIRKSDYIAELMPETLARTTFGKILPEKVNLELPLTLADALGGHLLMGHVDAIGIIAAIRKRAPAKILKVNFPAKFAKFVVPKGSIAVDGISLTVVAAGNNWFTVSLVDYTLKHATLGDKEKGDFVNLEFDLIAKYLKRIYEKA